MAGDVVQVAVEAVGRARRRGGCHSSGHGDRGRSGLAGLGGGHDLDALLGQLGRQRLEILFIQLEIDRHRLELLLREEPAVVGRFDHQPHTRLVHQLGRHQSLDSPVTVAPSGPGSYKEWLPT